MGNHVRKFTFKWLRGKCLFLFIFCIVLATFLWFKNIPHKNSLNESAKGELYHGGLVKTAQTEHTV